MKDSKGMFLMLGGVALFILIIGLITQTSQGKQTILSQYLHFSQAGVTPIPVANGLLNLKEITIGKVGVMVQTANTEAVREKGLGGIVDLPADQGMLFVFDNKNIKPTFWMKGMLIPLDFIWISKGAVNQIDKNIQAPAANISDDKIQRIVPNNPIDYILEVNSGFAAKNGIKVGDLVNL